MSNRDEKGGDFVQLLASALPGFRDLRAPLIAGYLWLLFLWIFIKPDLAVRPTDEVAGALYDLGRAGGPLWVGLAVGVGAFLMGSVSLVFSPLLNSLLARMKNFWWGIEHSETMQGRNLPRILRKSAERRQAEYARDPLYKYYPIASEKLSLKPNFDKYTGEVIDPDHEVAQKSIESGKALARETSLPATLLLGKDPELFTEADRLKSEGQLRFAVVPPLAVIVIYLAETVAPAWWLGLVPVVVLWIQGHSRNYDYESLMYGAIQLGHLHSPALEDLKAWVDEIPSLTAEERAAEDARLREVMNSPPDPELDRNFQVKKTRIWGRRTIQVTEAPDQDRLPRGSVQSRAEKPSARG